MKMNSLRRVRFLLTKIQFYLFFLFAHTITPIPNISSLSVRVSFYLTYFPQALLHYRDREIYISVVWKERFAICQNDFGRFVPKGWPSGFYKINFSV